MLLLCVWVCSKISYCKESSHSAIFPCYSPFLRSIFSLTFLDSYRQNVPYRLRHCADQIIKTTLTVNYKRIMSLAFIVLLVLLVFLCHRSITKYPDQLKMSKSFANADQHVNVLEKKGPAVLTHLTQLFVISDQTSLQNPRHGAPRTQPSLRKPKGWQFEVSAASKTFWTKNDSVNPVPSSKSSSQSSSQRQTYWDILGRTANLAILS